jgi:hypothetical protein
LEQLVRQALAEAQVRLSGQAVAVLGLQVDAPLHEPSGVSVSPLQVAVPHAVPTARTRQAPPPLHSPSRPQALEVSAAHSSSGSSPEGMPTQRPELCPVFSLEHALQVPSHSFSQHTSSTQKPERHCLSAVQAWPSVSWLWQVSSSSSQ